MSGSIPPTVRMLDHYRDAFLPIYREICGDEESYPLVETRFNVFLAATVGNTLYSDIMGKSAPAEEASKAFREFLAGGEKCHETSPAKTRSIGIQTPLEQALLSIRNATDAPALYEAWLKFRNAYLNIVNRLDELIIPQDQQVRSKSQREISGMSRLASDFALMALNELNKKVAPNGTTPTMPAKKGLQTAKETLAIPTDSPEYALIRAQRNKIIELQKRISEADGSLHPIEHIDVAAVTAKLLEFHKVWSYLKDPYSWISEVLFSVLNKRYFEQALEVKRGMKGKVELKPEELPETLPSFSHEKPLVLLEVIDRVFLAIVKTKDVLLEFNFDDVKKTLTVSSSRSLGKLRKDRTIADLVNQLDGTWELPSPWARLSGWLARKRVTHRISIPIRVTYSKPPKSAPATTPANNTGPAGPQSISGLFPSGGASTSAAGYSAAYNPLYPQFSQPYLSPTAIPFFPLNASLPHLTWSLR